MSPPEWTATLTSPARFDARFVDCSITISDLAPGEHGERERSNVARAQRTSTAMPTNGDLDELLWGLRPRVERPATEGAGATLEGIAVLG